MMKQLLGLCTTEKNFFFQLFPLHFGTLFNKFSEQRLGGKRIQPPAVSPHTRALLNNFVIT